LLTPILSTALLAGCLVTGPASGTTWTLRAPGSVVHAPHSRLRFTVETLASDGRPVDGVHYIWSVDWVGLHGAEHQGRSFREESILVKGEPGAAVLRIFAHDGGGGLVEVARSSVLVTRPEP